MENLLNFNWETPSSRTERRTSIPKLKIRYRPEKGSSVFTINSGIHDYLKIKADKEDCVQVAIFLQENTSVLMLAFNPSEEIPSYSFKKTISGSYRMSNVNLGYKISQIFNMKNSATFILTEYGSIQKMKVYSAHPEKIDNILTKK